MDRGPRCLRTETEVEPTELSAGVDLWWLPLGAGGRFVRLNGRIYESASATLHRRRAYDLYHSALEVHLGDREYVIEQAPVWSTEQPERGVVGQGPVGSRWLGRCSLFRYEVRCWLDGVIADRDEAVESPQRLSCDVVRAQRLLDLVPQAPTATWGRDELSAGEMWNSNSVISWLLARSGHAVQAIVPPARGRAPGWDAGLVVGSRSTDTGQPYRNVLGRGRGRHVVGR